MNTGPGGGGEQRAGLLAVERLVHTWHVERWTMHFLQCNVHTWYREAVNTGPGGGGEQRAGLLAVERLVHTW